MTPTRTIALIQCPLWVRYALSFALPISALAGAPHWLVLLMAVLALLSFLKLEAREIISRG